MALISCPECRKSVSDTARTCPGCGCDPRPRCFKCNQADTVSPSKVPVGFFAAMTGTKRYWCSACKILIEK